MGKKLQLLAKWSPVLLSVPVGVAIPILTAALAQTKIQGARFDDAIANVCSRSPSQTLADFLWGIAWDFAPFAVLMIVVGILVRHGSALSAWLSWISGVIAAYVVFATMHIGAETALLEKHWTASALASGFASLYATAVAFIVATSVGALTWLIQDRIRPSNPTLNADARQETPRAG